MKNTTPATIVALFIPIAVAFVPGFHDALAAAGGANVVTAAVGTISALVMYYAHKTPSAS